MSVQGCADENKMDACSYSSEIVFSGSSPLQTNHGVKSTLG